MNALDRFGPLLRWYPPAWRERYGGEMAALLEDTYGDGPVPRRAQVALARAGVTERARAASRAGGIANASEKTRSGSFLILCAWALCMVGGAGFAKFAEHWNAFTPRADQPIPGAGFTMVAVAGGVGVVLVAVAAVAVVPSFVRYVGSGGWAQVWPPIRRAMVAGVVAALGLVGVVVWAHRVSSHTRNVGFHPYQIAGIAWALTMLLALAMATAAAITVTRHVNVPVGVVRVLGAVAVGVALCTAVVIGGTVLWWAGMARYSSGFLGGGALSLSNVTPTPMVMAGLFMFLGLCLAAAGTVRIARAGDPLLRRRGSAQ